MSVSMMVSGPMMGDDDVDDVGDDVLSCPGSYYCFSPTLLPTRRELKLNCSRSHQSSVLERSYSDTLSKADSGPARS